MYTELRRYSDKEFCKSMKCYALERDDKCRAHTCVKTAKDFHRWLNENGFHLLVPTKIQNISGTKTCSLCGGKGYTEKYFDAGDHFGAGTAPGSGWEREPCKFCQAP